MDYSIRKAAEIMGISEDRLAKMVKEGTIIEENSGLVSENEIMQWKNKVGDLDGRRYSDLVFETKEYECNGRFLRMKLEDEAREHFKKEIEAYISDKWNDWDKKARKEYEAKKAEIEKKYAEDWKALGFEALKV
jgi:hypothetical protein